jgi:O-antigen/teichoic acid export membrane protein
MIVMGTVLTSLYRESLYNNSLFLMLSFLSISLFGFVFWIVAAKVLSIKDMGLAISIISFALLTTSIARFGIDSGFIRHFHACADRNHLYNVVVYVPLFISLLLTAVSLMALDYICPSIGFLMDGAYLVAYLSLIVLMSMNSSNNSALMVLKRSDYLFVQNLFLGLRVIIILIFPLLGIFSGILNILVSFVLAYAISNVFASLAIYRLDKLSLRPRIDYGSIKKIFSYSLGTYFSDIILLIPTSLLPLVVLNSLGPEESAYYSIACSLSFIIWMIPQAVSTALFVEGSYETPLRDNVIKALKFTYIMLIPVLIGIFLFGDQLLLLYNSDFSENSLELLKLFSISSLFATIVFIFSSIKKVKKEIKTLTIFCMINALLILSMAVPFLDSYGINGIGYVYIITNAILSTAIISLAVIRMFMKNARRRTLQECPS